MLQVKKTYHNINPEMLFDEVRDLVLKQGVVVATQKMQTYSEPTGATHTSRGTITFQTRAEEGKEEQECVRVHILGSAGGETRLMIDIDEALFAPERLSALEEDLSFIFGSYEPTED